MKLLKIVRSHNKSKKFDAVFSIDGRARAKTVSFGAAGYSDFTMNKDRSRQSRYLQRHRKNENWANPTSAGALSRYVLWSAPTLKQGIANYKRKFNL